MRPIHLTLSAFGSYGGVEEISFQEQRQGLFLIAGDTGSGKSTIFDGIMFALYGELSGKERKSNMMRSEYAEDDTDTWVEFTFSYQDQEGEKQYKIRRSPVYMRKSKRKNKDGEYTETKQGGTACLTLPSGKEITKLREIGEKIEEIIGLTSDQFSKIAMIAQGEFQELIMDKTGKRKEIFQKIFETRIYEQIELEIWERFKKEFNNQKENMTQMQTILEGTKLPEDEELRGKWNEAREKMDTEPELLEQLYEELLAEQKAMQQRKEKLRDEAQHRLTQVEQFQNSQRELENLVARGKELAVELAKRQEEMEESQKAYDVFCKSYDAEKKTLDQKMFQLSEQLPEYEKRDVAQRSLWQLTDQEKRLQKELALLQEQGMTLQAEQRKLEEQASGEEDCKLEEQKLRQKMENLSKSEGILDNGKKEFPKLMNLQRQLKAAQETCIASEVAYEAARREKEELDRRYIAAQAGLLAKDLQPGTPCPVCGSLEHPQPCPLSEEATVRDADLDKARKKEKEAERARDQAVATAADARQQYQVQESVLVQGMRELLSDFSVKTAEDSLQQLEMTLKQQRLDLESRLETCQAQIKAQEMRKNRLKELAEQLPHNAEQQKKVELDWEKVKGEKKAAEEKCAAWQAQLVYASLAEAKEGLQQLTAEANEWDAKKANMLTKLEMVKQNADGLRGKWEESQKVEAEKRTLLEKERKKDDRFAVASEELAELERNLRAEWKEASQVYDETKLMYETNRTTFRSWKEKKKERESLRKRYQVMKSLNDAARGKVYFQTYIQRQYFKQILHAANQRLSKMNANQFLLVCRELGAGGLGQQGLELDVLNPLTGKRRDAHTLSGGETFMASLAMALGLADVVQSRVGGTRLETMFIDEGFGSLSEEVRNMAVRVLLELADGNRLVGVVSHVTELKEQIPRKLLVTKDSKGSHTNWELD